eukprot:1050078-Ditylum_brightwellii.AAC.1
MGMLIKESTYGAVNANDQRTDGLGPVKVNMNKVLVSDTDVDIATSTSKLDCSMSTMAQEDVI